MTNNFCDKGPYHRFFLFDDTVSYTKAFEVSCDIKSESIINFSDDLLRYFNDYLSWVPTLFVIRNKSVRTTGLDYEGWSIIDIEGKNKAVIILQTIIELFKCGPSDLKLKGLYDIDKHDYTQLRIQKEQLIKLLGDLLSIVQKINGNKNEAKGSGLEKGIK